MDENEGSINIGKYEGFAWGILVLYKQPHIKKPEEQLTHLDLLGASDDRHILELLGSFCDLELDDNIKFVYCLTTYKDQKTN